VVLDRADELGGRHPVKRRDEDQKVPTPEEIFGLMKGRK
jgi:hypothetical protein